MTKLNGSKERLFEIFQRVTPDFKPLNEEHHYKPDFSEEENIDEEMGGNIQSNGQQPQQQAAPTPTVQQQPKQPSDVQNLSRVINNSNTIEKASSYINTATEFPEAFRVWFTGLGIYSKHAMPKGTVLRNVSQILDSLGYK